MVHSVLSVVRFKLDFHLLYVTTRAMVEVNRVRSKPFIWSRSILYVLVLEPFLHELKATHILGRIILTGAAILDRYSTYADDVSMLCNKQYQDQKN